MSDNWVQCPICGGDVGAGAVADYDRAAYETGVQDSMLRATQYERILLDLIAELRAYQEDRDTTEWLMDSRGECLCDGDYPDVDRCMLHNSGQVASMADRAEARLRLSRDD